MSLLRFSKGAIGLLIVTVFAPAVFVQGLPSFYDVVELERFGRAGGTVSAINDTGQAVGTVAGDLPVASVFWDINDDPADGETHLLAKPGYRFPRLDDINNKGNAVGMYIEEAVSSTKYAMKYDVRSRVLTKLAPLEAEGDNSTWATAINDMNIVVGMGGAPETHDGLVYVIWSGSSPSVIHPDRIFGSWAADINVNSVIATTLIQEDYSQVRGPAGSLTRLDLPPDHQTYGRVTAINDNDLTIGWIRRETVGNVHYDSAVLWDESGVPSILPPLASAEGAPFGINNAGDIVGVAGSMGVIWQYDGFEYRAYLLNDYVKTPGWDIRRARDINNNGWILAEGLFGDSHYKPVILIPRIDEFPPEGYWKERSPMTGSTFLDLLVYWEDDGIIDESTLDGQDLRIQQPDGSSVHVELKHIGKPVGVSDKYRWPVTYRMAAPGGEWDGADEGSYIIFVEGEAVADQSGRTVEAGELGHFHFSAVEAAVWIRRGIVMNKGSDPRYCFDFGLDGTAHRYQNYPEINYISFTTPSAESFTLTEDPIVVYTYSLRETETEALLPFEDGDYELFIKFAIGSHAWNLWYGDVETRVPLTAPVQVPELKSIRQTSYQDVVEVDLEWEPVVDEAVTSILLSVRDQGINGEVFSVQIDDTTITSWGPIALERDRNYTVCLSFENRVEDQPIEVWRLTASKYLANEVEFETSADQQPLRMEASLRLESGPSLYLEGRAGTRARVEYNTSLSPGGWQELMTTILGGQEEAIPELGDAGAAARFFRVVVQDQ